MAPLALAFGLVGAAQAAGSPGAGQPTGVLSPAAPAVGNLARAPIATSLRYDTDYPLIGYADRPTHNAIARLQDRLDKGATKLKFVPGRGYLDSLLQTLGIDPSSQTLVYSKTSLQIDLIRAATPRAIYFDDDTYVAWMPGTNFLEVSTMDSALGPVFYTLPDRDPASTHFDRETLRCLTCHDTFSLMGGGVPRFLFMSSPVTVTGEPLTTEISVETTDATPLQDRWGGWYVTGKPNGLMHLGNIRMTGPVKSVTDFASLLVNRPGTLENLAGLFDTQPYRTDRSDVVALLVLEPLVKALLQVDAAPLPGKIAGNSGFDGWFQAQGPRDAQGRSLRELDLGTRLLRYPLSYMIYSAGFDGLPGYAKEG